MTITFATGNAKHAVFAGNCAPEEADALLEWLRATPAPSVDLGACDALHTALVQLLLAASARIVAPPPDAVLAACLQAGGCVRFLPREMPPRAGVSRPARGGERAAGAGYNGAVEQINLGAI
jgi:hypothetical protein